MENKIAVHWAGVKIVAVLKLIKYKITKNIW